jgi:hypothetical protein
MRHVLSMFSASGTLAIQQRVSRIARQRMVQVSLSVPVVSAAGLSIDRPVKKTLGGPCLVSAVSNLVEL